MQYTTNLNMPRPELDDEYYQEDFNTALDIIDENIGSINEVIDDMNNLDSIVAITEAKGTFDTLEDRLDNSDLSLEQKATQITDMQISVKDFGAKGDWNGSTGTDDTVAIQSALDSLTSGGKLVFEKNKKYMVTTPVNINYDNVEVDLRGSTIIWNGTVNINNSQYRDKGMLTVKGTWGVAKNITSFTPRGTEYIADDTLYGMGIVKDRCSVVTEDNSQFNIGDYVGLNISTGTQSDSTYTPAINIITKVIGKDDTKLYLNYSSPWDFSNLTITGTLTKANVRKNVHIKNINLYDNYPATREANYTYTYNTDERNKMVAGVSLTMTANCSVKYLYAENTKFPAVLSTFGYGNVFENIELHKPNIIGSGEGYCVQNYGSLFSTIRNIRANEERHLIDFSASAYCSVENAFAYNSMHTSFDMHGCYEHNLTFTNCVGNFMMGNGSEFGNAVKNIYIKNLKGVMFSQYAENLIVEESDVELYHFNPYSVTFKNCTIKLNRKINIYPLTKGLSLENSIIKFKDCVLYNYNGAISDTSWTFIKNYYRVVIDHCFYDVLNKNSANNGLEFRDIVHLQLTNNRFNHLFGAVSTTTSSKTCYITVDNNTFDTFDDLAGNMFNIDNIFDGCIIFLKFTRNTVNFSGASLLRWLRIYHTGGFGASNIYTSILGNIINATNSNALSLYIDTTTCPTVKPIVKDNIFKNGRFDVITVSGTDNLIL